MKKLTPVLVVDAVEPCLPFWTERLGFAQVARVPESGPAGFVILSRGGVEVMLQTRESLRADAPGLVPQGTGSGVILYVDVEQLEPLLRELKGVEIVVPPRVTSYGAREIFVRAPGGHVIGFAAPA